MPDVGNSKRFYNSVLVIFKLNLRWKINSTVLSIVLLNGILVKKTTDILVKRLLIWETHIKKYVLC